MSLNKFETLLFHDFHPRLLSKASEESHVFAFIWTDNYIYPAVI